MLPHSLPPSCLLPASSHRVTLLVRGPSCPGPLSVLSRRSLKNRLKSLKSLFPPAQAPTDAFGYAERWSYTERWGSAAAGSRLRAAGWEEGTVAAEWVPDLPLHPTCLGDGKTGGGCFPVVGGPGWLEGAGAAAGAGAPGGGLVFWPIGESFLCKGQRWKCRGGDGEGWEEERAAGSEAGESCVCERGEIRVVFGASHHVSPAQQPPPSAHPLRPPQGWAERSAGMVAHLLSHRNQRDDMQAALDRVDHLFGAAGWAERSAGMVAHLLSRGPTRSMACSWAASHAATQLVEVPV